MDWNDIVLHAMASVAFVGLVGLWKPDFAMGFNTVFWPAREFVQHNGIPHSLQSNLEWIVPVLLGWLVWEVIHGRKESI